jgi:hypothetical protein
MDFDCVLLSSFCLAAVTAAVSATTEDGMSYFW